MTTTRSPQTRVGVANRIRRDVLVSALTALVVLTHVHFTERDVKINTTGDALLRTYDPAQNSEQLATRLKTQCPVSMPSEEEVRKYRNFGVRLVSYYNIHEYLSKRWSRTPKTRLKVLGNERFLARYESFLDIDKQYVDLHHIPHPSNTFDVIAADQVLEHVIFPQLLMLELHRVLKPGGIAILTTISYNPVHEGGKWHDYWRFMMDGLLTLSLPFRNVPLCGAWGNAKAISSRAAVGIAKDDKQPSFESSMRVNEKQNPFVVWIIVEK